MDGGNSDGKPPKKRCVAGVVCRLAAEPPRRRPVAPRADVSHSTLRPTSLQNFRGYGK